MRDSAKEGKNEKFVTNLGVQKQCRMYEAEYPERDDLVVVRVVKINDVCAYVQLLEYQDKEGVILLSNLTPKRLRTIKQHIRVNKEMVLQVIRVDKEKGYIDLNKKYMEHTEIEECNRRFTYSKTVHSIMADVATKQTQETPLSLMELYEQFGWELYKKYGHAFYAFEKIAAGEDVFSDLDSDLPQDIKNFLIKAIRHRLAAKPVKIQANVQITCFGYEGIDAIKPALKAGLQANTEKYPLDLKLVSSPDYSVTTTAVDIDKGKKVLQDVIGAITNTIKRKGGDCAVKTPPHAV